MTKLLLPLALLSALGGAAWFYTQDGDAGVGDEAVPESALYTVRRGPLTITVTESGTMVAKDSERVSPNMRSRGQIEWLIEEGTMVAEGEVVARLDTLQLEQDIEEEVLDELQAIAGEDNARTDLEIQLTDNEASLEKGQLDLDKARKELEKFLKGDSEKERRNLAIAIADARTEETKARRQRDDSMKLLDKDYITKIEFEEHEIALERAEVRLQSAEKDLELYETYTYPLDLQAKQTAVRDAERALDTAKKKAVNQKRQKEVNLEQASKRLERIQGRLKQRREYLERMTLRAPCPGIVLYGDPKEPWSRDEIKVGNDFWGRETLMTIPDLRVMQVKIYVHEADVYKLAKGQPAKVSMDTYPGRVFDGSVTRVASIADESSRQRFGSEVKMFAVEVTLQEIEDIEMRPGVSAKAEIFVDELSNVVHVPLQCVFRERGVDYCWVLADDDRPALREVKKGPNNDQSIVIEEGLEVGERVLLYNPRLGSGGGGGDAEEAEDEGAAATPDAEGDEAGSP